MTIGEQKLFGLDSSEGKGKVAKVLAMAQVVHATRLALATGTGIIGSL